MLLSLWFFVVLVGLAVAAPSALVALHIRRQRSRRTLGLVADPLARRPGPHRWGTADGDLGPRGRRRRIRSRTPSSSRTTFCGVPDLIPAATAVPIHGQRCERRSPRLAICRRTSTFCRGQGPPP